MSIEIPRALSDEVLSRYVQPRIDRGDNEVWPPELAREFRQEDMHEALTAALGAWVVPACYRLHQPNHSSEWISGMYGGPPMNHKAWSVEQTFTLLKEKPE